MDREDQGKIQRADVDPDGRVALTLYRNGQRRHLLLDPVARAMTWSDERPEKVGPVPARQKILRKELTGAVLDGMEDKGAGLCVLRATLRGTVVRALMFEQTAPRGRVVLCAIKGDKTKVIEVFGDRKPDDGRDLKKGRVYQPPAPVSPDERPSPVAAPEPLPSARPVVDPVRSALLAEKKRLARLVKNRRRDADKHKDPDGLFVQGEWLKAHLHHVHKGQHELVVEAAEGPLSISLDPTLGPVQNLERLFGRAKRARRAQAQIRARLDEAESLLKTAAELLIALDEDAAHQLTREEVRAFLDARARRPAAQRQAGGRGPRRPYRAFFHRPDQPIYVGRSAKDNDALTFKVARGNDTWLHARGVSGSHVVVPAPPGDVGTERLLDAAHLAVHFSKLRGQSRADVSYTARKHVKKPGKGAPAGLVTVEQERVLHLVVDEDRLNKLLQTERNQPG